MIMLFKFKQVKMMNNHYKILPIELSFSTKRIQMKRRFRILTKMKVEKNQIIKIKMHRIFLLLLLIRMLIKNSLRLFLNKWDRLKKMKNQLEI